MNRFFGMMPSSEVKIEKRFKVGYCQHEVTVQASDNGWTILYADCSSEYKDIVDTAENNLNRALLVLKGYFTDIKEV